MGIPLVAAQAARTNTTSANQCRSRTSWSASVQVAQRAAADPTGRHREFASRCLLRHGRELSPLSTLGDSINAILSAAAMNFGKPIRFYWPILFQILESLLPKLSNDRKYCVA